MPVVERGGCSLPFDENQNNRYIYIDPWSARNCAEVEYISQLKTCFIIN